jgi:hypothetical protein
MLSGAFGQSGRSLIIVSTVFMKRSDCSVFSKSSGKMTCIKPIDMLLWMVTRGEQSLAFMLIPENQGRGHTVPYTVHT